MSIRTAIRTAILGASGYAGGELVRILDGHPSFEPTFLGGHGTAGQTLASVHPHLSDGDRVLEPLDEVDDVEAAFLALPHGASWSIAAELADRGVRVLDLSSDYRMDTSERYQLAYGEPHPAPERLAGWAYGLPEIFGDLLVGADRVAVPGCYPTSALLGLAPLVASGVIDGPVVVDSMSGVTGAGRGAHADLTYGAIDQSVRAYGIGGHRHRPEIEMGLAMVSGAEVPVQFTPHLVPMQRGILSTCSAARASDVGVAALLADAYAKHPFVDVIDQPPQTRWVVGSNRALIHAVDDKPTGRVIIVVAIDNLVKGAAGQAVQCANISFGLPEEAGLSSVGWLP